MSDAAYRTFDYRFQNGGLVARDVLDKLRPGTYRNLENLESRQENSLGSRYGLAALSTDGVNNFPLAAPAQSLSRMVGLSNPFNYAVGGGFLYRKTTDGLGGYTQISSGLSGGRASMYPYRPSGSSQPYMFIADASKMVKDNGATASQWGIAPPTQPALISPAPPGLLDIELFNEGGTGSFFFSAFTSPTETNRVQATIAAVTATGIQAVGILNQAVGIGGFQRNAGGTVTTVTTSSPHGYVTGMRVAISPSDTFHDSSFASSSSVITVTGTFTFTYPNVGTANQTSAGAGVVNPYPSIQPGMSLTTTDGAAETVYVTEVTGLIAANLQAGIPFFIANFKNTHLANTGVVDGSLTGSVAANSTGLISKTFLGSLNFTSPQADNSQNYVQIWLNVANPLAILQIAVAFDVGDGTFTQDYYSKAIQQSPAQPVASGTITAAIAQSKAVFQRATGGIQYSTLGGDNPTLVPTDYPLLQQLQNSALNPGLSPWTYITVPLSTFVAYGAAGTATNTWANVVGWRITITTQPNIGTSVGLSDLVFVGGSDLNSLAGQPYDYRYTFYNLVTGTESGPSVEMVGDDLGDFSVANNFKFAAVPVPLSVQNQAIVVTPLQPTDPQVTHIRIYRRGGTLTQGWYFVTQIPVGQATFTDTIADSIIVDNNLLNINADAPVTALLPTPLNTTVSIGPNTPAGIMTVPFASGPIYPGQLVTLGTGINQEQLYVQAVTATTITIYSQLNNTGGVSQNVPLTATTRPQQPVSIFAIAFDKAWFAGDPNNPHILYYSTTFSPETVPVQNFLEVGTPDAPIFALIELNGLLFVFTTKRVYEVLGAGSSVPTVIPTAVKHGLRSDYAWCAAENVIYYQSYDGIYAFTGGASGYMSEPVEWIFTGKNLGPVPAVGTSGIVNMFMAYCNHEVFVCYQDQGGVAHRLIYHDVYRRWRNDDLLGRNVTAMYFAEDTGEFFVGCSDSMVYQDRVLDYDSGGLTGGVPIVNAIPFSLQTAQMDQAEASADNAKRFKIYNELTVDMDPGSTVGAAFNVYAVFDSGTTQTLLGTIPANGLGRQQFQFNINQGNGYESLNIGLLITGSTTTPVTFVEVHIRAAPQAEYRKSWDTWWIGQGTDEWHVYKQVFAEYQSQDAAGVPVNIYIDGNMAVPIYTFTMPQSPQVTAPAQPQRVSRKFRLPAIKCRLIRFVGTSASNFRMYDDTQLEHKKLGSQKGYERGKISP